MSFEARSPDYKVKARLRSGGGGGIVGAAWVNQDGSVSITLNAFVVLQASTDLQITLFPRDEGPEARE